MADKQKILAGRNIVDVYRTAHTKLHEKPWHKGVPILHTPLLVVMVNGLDGLGFISTETDFEPRKNAILAKFWKDSDLENIKGCGFKDWKDFNENVTNDDKQKLEGMWH